MHFSNSGADVVVLAGIHDPIELVYLEGSKWGNIYVDQQMVCE